MNITGLVCEYNPFHNGHRYHLQQLRQEGADCLIGCMSGHFTQRGEPSVLSRADRARAALENGLDLVIELPAVFACAGAERFAYGGMAHLDALGICDTVSFGSESGSVAALQRASQAVLSPRIREPLRKLLSSGMTFAAAREQAVREVFGEETAALLREPNNILGIEYAKALRRLNSSLQLHTVRRVGAPHDSTDIRSGYASASGLREMLTAGGDISPYVPESTLPFYGNAPDRQRQLEKLSLLTFYRLKTMTLSELAALPEMSEGLENRLYKAIQQGTTTAGILSLAKCKRYPLSRLRRSLLHAFLHLTSADFQIGPQYLRVLAFNEKGQAALRRMKTAAALPVVQRHADRSSLSDAGKHLLEIEDRCDTLYQLLSSP